METYGNYMQRAFEAPSWNYYNVTQPILSLKASKYFGAIKQDVQKELFESECSISSQFSCSSRNNIELEYVEQYDSTYAIRGYKIFDLLPEGMKLASTEEEIVSSLSISGYAPIYDIKLKRLDKEDFKKHINTTVNILENWRNTGRTKIEIAGYFEDPIYISYSNLSQNYIDFKYTYNFNISYNSFLEYGNVWTNYCYVDKLDEQEKGVELFYNNIYYKIPDNGYYDSEAIDIDEDGDITDELSCAKAQTTITSVISTHQDVQKSVKTDKSNFSTETVESSLDSEYEYKLRVRIGQNDVTNLIIYDSLEKYTQNPDGETVPAYGDKDHWNGEFLGIDTSYAESKGYKVKTYYSENVEAGNLYDEVHNLNSEYMEYTNTTDKSKVKSLAFEYLDADGNPAIIPANSLTYVLIKMKSPTDENIKSYAYNGCRTQWQALDEFNQPVDFITGINSNIVKVALPNSEEAYGSYLVKHEYYYRDYKGDLILENTVSEEPVHNIPVDTVIKAEDQNHLSTNNNKQYTYTEDTGDIIIEKDVTKEITIKYIREQEYGSYVVKHEYYVKDFDNNLTLENTYSEELVPNIPIDTIIKANYQNHMETNNDKQYMYTKDTGDIIIQKDIIKEIIIKYVREEEYTTELPETGSTEGMKNLIYVLFFLLMGITSFFVANKKRKFSK